MSRVESLARASEARCAIGEMIVEKTESVDEVQRQKVCASAAGAVGRGWTADSGQRGQVQVQEPGLSVYSDRAGFYVCIRGWPPRSEVRCAYG